MLLVLSEWEPLDKLDRDVADRLNDVARGDSGLVDALEVGSVALSPWIFRLAVLAVAVWLWRRGAQRLAAWSVVTMAIGGILGVVLKYLVDRARPSFPEPVAHASGYSFPSGHALNSFLAVGVLLLVFLPVLTRAGRAVAFTLGCRARPAHRLRPDRPRRALRQRRPRGLGRRTRLSRRDRRGLRDLAPRAWPPASTVTEGVEPEAADEMCGPLSPTTLRRFAPATPHRGATESPLMMARIARTAVIVAVLLALDYLLLLGHRAAAHQGVRGRLLAGRRGGRSTPALADGPHPIDERRHATCCPAWATPGPSSAPCRRGDRALSSP